MTLETPRFVHEFEPGSIHYGRGCIDGIGDAAGERVLVVCGSNVGGNDDLMDPVRAGLGESLVETFARTTPEKEIETAYDGVERMRDLDIDALVAVGGGSSLDIATVMCALDADYRSMDEVREEVRETGYISAPDDPAAVTPLLAVPTTLAGADLTAVGGIMVPMDGERVGAGAVGDALKPSAGFYDPDLFDTTPTDVLVGSAMNGFDKGVEALYARKANPLTDAMAVRGLEYLDSGLPRLRSADDPSAMERAVVGTILVQHGRMAGSSIVHAFGHGLRRHFGVQQGLAHAVVVPGALRLLFEAVDGRRDLLAEALGGEGQSTDPAATAVGRVERIRDGLGLPSRLRELDAVTEDGLRRAAELTREDSLMRNAPPGFDPTADELESVLRDAW